MPTIAEFCIYHTSDLIELPVYRLWTTMLMQEKKLEVQIETSFEEFMKWLQDAKQTLALDTGNIKLTYNSVSMAAVFEHTGLY